jgi:PD-(D/E)XK endonuclease
MSKQKSKQEPKELNQVSKEENQEPAPKIPHPRLRPNTKRTGERSEAAFLHKASSLGFGVARPWGDSERYDFILDNGRQLLRIQTKATNSLRAQAYETRATYTTGKRRAVYTRNDIDFLVAHVIPLDLWYILPVEICTPQPMLRFYPHRQAKKMRLEQYREAWHLLEPKPNADNKYGLEIQAAAEETFRDLVWVFPFKKGAVIKDAVISSAVG